MDAAREGQIAECIRRKQAILAPGRLGFWPVDQHASCFPLVPSSNRILRHGVHIQRTEGTPFGMVSETGREVTDLAI
jgi:hypothetical protein